MKKHHTKKLFQLTIFLRTILIDLFGELFWNLLFFVMYYFNMIELELIKLLKIFPQTGTWSLKWYAYFILIIVTSILSMIIAFIYLFLFKQRKSWIMGAVYGVLIWILMYGIVPMLIKNYNPLIHLNTNSHIAMFCLFLLYGVFVGYSISYEYENIREEYLSTSK